MYKRQSLAGVDSPDQARRIISSTANLTFRDVNDNLLMDASVLEEGGASVGQDQYGNYVVNLSLKDSDTFYPVSYTHLDVYKRQGYEHGEDRFK